MDKMALFVCPFGFRSPFGFRTPLVSAGQMAFLAGLGSLAIIESRTHAISNLTGELAKELVNDVISGITTAGIAMAQTRVLSLDESVEKVKAKTKSGGSRSFLHGSSSGVWTSALSAGVGGFLVDALEGCGQLGIGFYTTAGEDFFGAEAACQYALARSRFDGGVPFVLVFSMDDNTWNLLSKRTVELKDVLGNGVNIFGLYGADVVIGPMAGAVAGYGALPPTTLRYKFEGGGVLKLAPGFVTAIPLVK